MKRFYKAVALLWMVAFVATACGSDKPKDKNEQVDNAEAKTKVVVEDGIQFAFDLIPMAEHKKMMKSMGIKMDGHKDANYGMLITLIDKASSDIIKKANLDIVLTEAGSGKKLKPKTEIMAGGGMYHYGAHLKLPDQGMWKVKVTAKIKGKKVTAKTKFKL